MIRAHKIRLNPTSDQANYLARAAGTSRFMFNWGLGQWKRQTEALRFCGKILGAWVTKTASWWFVSIQVAVADKPVTNQKQKCHTLHPDLTFVARIFVCMNLACGYMADRDYNASLNLEQEACLLASPG